MFSLEVPSQTSSPFAESPFSGSGRDDTFLLCQVSAAPKDTGILRVLAHGRRSRFMFLPSRSMHYGCAPSSAHQFTQAWSLVRAWSWHSWALFPTTLRKRKVQAEFVFPATDTSLTAKNPESWAILGRSCACLPLLHCPFPTLSDSNPPPFPVLAGWLPLAFVCFANAHSTLAKTSDRCSS